MDLPPFEKGVRAIQKELDDCAFPLLAGVNVHVGDKGFDDVDYALLIGSKPRGPGMERSDLIKDNANIFKHTGKLLNRRAKGSTKVIVVGNPANTNCMILAHYASDLPKENMTAMMRLDHDRSFHQLRKKLECEVSDLQQFCVWGNHSPTMYPYVGKLQFKGKSVEFDHAWLHD